MAGKDCDCGKVKVTQFGQPRPPVAAHHATGGPSLVEALLRAADILGEDTKSMANAELVDALCTALVTAREEKQALAKALDECGEDLEELEGQLTGDDDDDTQVDEVAFDEEEADEYSNSNE